MVRISKLIILLFASYTAFSQSPTFPRFRLIQLQQSQEEGQIITADSARNAIWSSDLRVQDSIFYIFGNPYIVDSTRLDNDTLKYYQNGNLIGFDIIATIIDSTRLYDDTLKYFQNGVEIGYDLIVTIIDSTRLNPTKDTLFYYQNGSTVGFDLIDGDATNELQEITEFVINNDSLFITLSDDVQKAVSLIPYINTDTSGFNRDFYILNDTLYINDDNGTLYVDLLPYLDNTDEQTLSLVNNILSISNGNNVDLSAYLDNTDTSGFNRSFILLNDTLFITDDNSTLSVILEEYTNTDTSGYNSNFYIVNDSLFISDGSNTFGVDLSYYTTDTSGYNFAFEIINDTLYIEDGNSRTFVSLIGYLDNTDTSGYNINFSYISDTLYLTDGLSTQKVFIGGVNTDTSGYNYSFILQDSTLLLQDDNSTLQVDISSAYDNTDTSGYNSDFVITNNILYIQDGLTTLSVDLNPYLDNTDTSGFNRTFEFSNDTLYITDDNSQLFVDLSSLNNLGLDTSGYNDTMYINTNILYIQDGLGIIQADLSPYLDNTDDQQLTKVGDTIYLESGGQVALEDDDPINELQSLIRQQDSLFLTQDGGIQFPIDSTRLNERGDSLIYYDENGVIYKRHIHTLLDVIDACYVLDTLGWVYDTSIGYNSNIEGDLYITMQSDRVAEQGSTTPAYSIDEIRSIYNSITAWKEEKDSLYPGAVPNVYFAPSSAVGYYQTWASIQTEELDPTNQPSVNYFMNNSNIDSVYLASLDSFYTFPSNYWIDTIPNVGTYVHISNSAYTQYYGYKRITGEFGNEFYFDYRGGIGTSQDAPTSTYTNGLNNLSNWLASKNGSFTFMNINITPSYTYNANGYRFSYQEKAHILASYLDGLTPADTNEVKFYFGDLAYNQAKTLTSFPLIYSAIDELLLNNWYSESAYIKDMTGVNEYYIDVKGDFNIDTSSQYALPIFNTITFDIDTLIDSIPILDTLSVSLWQDYSNNILSMRTIHSDNLLISVDSTGCITINDTSTASQYIYIVNDTLRITGSDSIVDLRPYADSTRLNVFGDSLIYYQAGEKLRTEGININQEVLQDTISTFIEPGLGIDISYNDEDNSLLIQSLNFEEIGKNLTQDTLYKGYPVYQVDSNLNGNLVGVAYADAADPSKMPAVGILEETLAPGEEGKVLFSGYIGGVNTSLFNTGDIVYVAAGGGYTNIRPYGEGKLVQNLGRVLKVHPTNGSGIIMGAGRSNDVPNLNPGHIFYGSVDSVAISVPLDSFVQANNYWTKVGTFLRYNEGNVGVGIDNSTIPFYELQVQTDSFISSTITTEGIGVQTVTSEANSFTAIGNLNDTTGVIQSYKYTGTPAVPSANDLALNPYGGNVGIRTSLSDPDTPIDSTLTVFGGIRGTRGFKVGNYDFRTLQDTTDKDGQVLTFNSIDGVIELNTISLDILDNQEFVLTTSYEIDGTLQSGSVVSYLLVPKTLQGCRAISVEFYTNPQLTATTPDTFTVRLGEINLASTDQLEFLQLASGLGNSPYGVDGATTGKRYEILDTAYFQSFSDAITTDSTIYALRVTDYVPSTSVLARSLTNTTFTTTYHFTCETTPGASYPDAGIIDTVLIDISGKSYIDTIIVDETLIYNEITTDTVELRVDTTIITTTKALNDSLFNQIDITRLSGDSLLYYRGGVLIGYDTLYTGDGVVQEKFIGNGVSDSLLITPYNGYLPTDKNDVLVYRNGLFIDQEYISELNSAAGLVVLSFVPDAGDRMMLVWYTGRIITQGSSGLDTVATDMTLIGNGLVTDRLGVNPNYVASIAYVDSAIAQAGGGDITSVNINTDSTYGIIGGAETGGVNLRVDTSIIGTKAWVNAQGFNDFATEAQTLQTPRNIGLTGNAVQSSTAASFDGSADVNITLNEINATYLTTGTVPNARLSGSYGINVTGSAGSVEWNNVQNKPSTFPPSAHNQAWSTITSTPTTLGGYGITDAVTLSTTQTISGAKTFSNVLTVNNIISAERYSSNVVVGKDAGTDLSVSLAVGNTAIGKEAMANNTQGDYGVYLGYKAGGDLWYGDHNVYVGYNTHGDIVVTPEADRDVSNFMTIIGSNAEGTGDMHEIVIGAFVDGIGDSTITIGRDLHKKFKTNRYIFNIDQNITGMDGYVLTYNENNNEIELQASSGGGGIVESLTFNNSGSGDASGTVFDGSTAKTISYNTVGAPATDGTNATGSWNIDITGKSNKSDSFLIVSTSDNSFIPVLFSRTFSAYSTPVATQNLLLNPVLNDFKISNTNVLIENNLQGGFLMSYKQNDYNTINYSDGAVYGISEYYLTNTAILNIAGFEDDLYLFNPNQDGNIYIGTTSTALSNAMSITSDKKVGINRTTPGKTLDVNGDINFTGTLYNNNTPLLADSIAYIWINDSTDHYLPFTGAYNDTYSMLFTITASLDGCVLKEYSTSSEGTNKDFRLFYNGNLENDYVTDTTFPLGKYSTSKNITLSTGDYFEVRNDESFKDFVHSHLFYIKCPNN